MPTLGESDFLAGLQSLLPRGRAWPRDGSATLTRVLDGWARAYAPVNTRQAALVADAFPTTTVELAPEWEATLALPDLCLGPAPTLQARQVQIRARFIGLIGQSPAAFTAYAAQLGFPIAITEFAPFRAGISRSGDSCQAPQPAIAGLYFLAGSGVAGQSLVDWSFGQTALDWAHAFKVTVVKEPTFFFRAGQSSAGEALADWSGQALAAINYFAAGVSHSGDPIKSWGAPVLECELRRIKPGQSTITFAYSA